MTTPTDAQREAEIRDYWVVWVGQTHETDGQFLLRRLDESRARLASIEKDTTAICIDRDAMATQLADRDRRIAALEAVIRDAPEPKKGPGTLDGVNPYYMDGRYADWHTRAQKVLEGK